LGITLLTYWFSHSYFRYQSLSVPVLEEHVSQAIHSEPVRVTIEGLFDLEVTSAIVSNGRWGVNPNLATYLPVSAAPGQPGNTIIYGHNKQNVMGKLRQIKVGQSISILSEDGSQHLYRVTNIQTVDTSRTDLLTQTDHELLTLYTCTGPLDSLRFVVQAVPLD